MSRHPVVTAIATAAALLCGAAAQAQIRTDGTVGAAQSLTGPAYVIPQNLGRVSGGNLFQSFSTFNIGSNESATFTTTSSGIGNVISRVTGGSASSINGTLRLSAASGAPDLFFINPAGVTFGKGASIDVPGAFHVGTADYLKFADGRWYADPQKASSFSSAAPEAFGFLGSSRAAVTVQGGAVLVPKRTNALSLVAGDIAVDNATLAVGSAEARLAAVGQDAVEVNFSGALPQASGRLAMRNGGSLTSYALDGKAGGRIVVSAGEVSLDGDAYLYSTHGDDAASTAGAGGDIELAVRNTLSLTNVANITSDTVGKGAAGNVQVQAGLVQLSSSGYLASSSGSGASGRAGAITVESAGALTLASGASIFSLALGSGGAQGIRLKGAGIAMDQSTVLGQGGSGSASVSITSGGLLSLSRGSSIGTATDGAATAGAVQVRSGSLQLSGQSNLGSTASEGSGGSGPVDVAVGGAVSLTGLSSISSSSSMAGDAGNVSLSAASLLLDNSGINSNAVVPDGVPLSVVSLARSGNVAVTVGGSVSLRNASAIDTSTLTAGTAGNVSLKAGDLTLDGNSNINSRSLARVDGFTGAAGGAGNLDIAAGGQIALRGGSGFSTSTGTVGDAGAIKVSAAAILLDENSAINSLAGLYSFGRAGSVSVNAGGALQLRQESSISAVTGGFGDAGDVRVSAGSVSLDQKSSLTSASNGSALGNAGNVSVEVAGELSLRGTSFVSTSAFGLGNAGDVTVRAGSVTVDSAASISSDVYYGATGNAGRVDVQAVGDVVLLNSSGQKNDAGQISSSTFSTGNGGQISVKGRNVRLDGSGASIVSFAVLGSSGRAGNIEVQAGNDVVMTNGGGISTSTFSTGDGGSVSVRAANVTVSGAGAGVTSFAQIGSSGRGGDIDVQASGDLRIHDGGLTSSTLSTGAAGSVQARAARITIDGAESGISAAAAGFSGGQVGSVQVQASELITVANGGFVSISNGATVVNPAQRQPGSLRVSAPDILLRGGLITAASSGNVAASGIAIDFGNRLSLVDSGITTSANAGNGGAIRIGGAGGLALTRSQITTSVLGSSGNGGDIDIAVNGLALNSGFIQANTAARNASGGLVRIATNSLVASNNSLLLGGNVPYLFRPELAGANVIQAAAPTGVSGVIDVTSPVLDVTGSLLVLRADVIDAAGLGRGLCQASGGSTLAQAGRGGLPPSARGLLRAERVPAGNGGARAAALSPIVLAGLPGRGCL